MSYFDFAKLSKEQEDKQKAAEKKELFNNYILDEFRKDMLETFDIYCQIAKEYPALAKIYNLKTHTAIVGFKRGIFRHYMDYKVVQSKPYYAIPCAHVDEKGIVLLKCMDMEKSKEIHFRQTVYTIIPYTKGEFDKHFINYQGSPSYDIYAIENGRVRIKSGLHTVGDEASYTLLFHLAKRTYEYKVLSYAYHEPVDILLGKKRKYQEIVELLKNDILTFAQGNTRAFCDYDPMNPAYG